MKTYTGKILSNGQKVVIVTIEGAPPTVRYTLPHIMVHSAGLEWGYGGSGPHDLALSILADYLGEPPEQVVRYATFGRLGVQCPTCRGEGFITEEIDRNNIGLPTNRTYACQECEDGAIYPPVCKAVEAHHMFVWNWVAHWHQDCDWELAQTEIEAFLALDTSVGFLPQPEVES